MRPHQEMIFTVGVRVVAAGEQDGVATGWQVIVDTSDNKQKIVTVSDRQSAYVLAANHSRGMFESYVWAGKEAGRE